MILHKKYYSFYIKPIVFYNDFLLYKRTILKENREKAGVYRLINKTSNESYIGSSINLSPRFKNYYSLRWLNNYLLKRNSHIYKAIVEQGHSNFVLEILEYCKKEHVKIREQYYMDKYNPQYNIHKYANSCLGFRHSSLTKERMRLVKLGIPNLHASYPLLVIDLEENNEFKMPSIQATADLLKLNSSTIAKRIRKYKFYREKRYLITRII